MKINYKILLWLIIFNTFIFSGFLLYDHIYDNSDGIFTNYSIYQVAFKIQLIIVSISFVLCGFGSKNKYIQNSTIFFTTTTIFLVIFEVVSSFTIKNINSNNAVISGPNHSLKYNDNLGYVPTPNSKINGLRTINKETIYNINFETDSNSLRITPIDSTTNRTHFAQFFGCSITFGEGLQSNQTIPYYFGKSNHFINPYNLAYSGYGPHHMLARLQSKEHSKIVKEKNGVAFYIYINDHVSRAVCNIVNFGYNGGNAPYFINENGKIVRKGNFSTSRKLKNYAYSAILKSNFLKLFKVGSKYKLTNKQFEHTADIMIESAKEYKRKFKNDQFYVIIYPTNDDCSKIISSLKAGGVKVLDYSKLFDPTKKEYFIPFDGHPTALANQILVKKLTDDLKTKNIPI